MTYASDSSLIKQSGADSSVCEWCRGTFLTADLEWTVQDWESISGRRGHVTATLCPACRELALAHCWRCGSLTGSKDDLCADCEEEAP